MDPTATVKELRLAIRRGDSEEARDYANALKGWLDKGGFIPDGETRASCEELLSWVFDSYGDYRDGVYD